MRDRACACAPANQRREANVLFRRGRSGTSLVKSAQGADMMSQVFRDGINPVSVGRGSCVVGPDAGGLEYLVMTGNRTLQEDGHLAGRQNILMSKKQRLFCQVMIRMRKGWAFNDGPATDGWIPPSRVPSPSPGPWASPFLDPFPAPYPSSCPGFCPELGCSPLAGWHS